MREKLTSFLGVIKKLRWGTILMIFATIVLLVFGLSWSVTQYSMSIHKYSAKISKDIIRVSRKEVILTDNRKNNNSIVLFVSANTTVKIIEENNRINSTDLDKEETDRHCRIKFVRSGKYFIEAKRGNKTKTMIIKVIDHKNKKDKNSEIESISSVVSETPTDNGLGNETGITSIEPAINSSESVITPNVNNNNSTNTDSNIGSQSSSGNSDAEPSVPPVDDGQNSDNENPVVNPSSSTEISDVIQP